MIQCVVIVCISTNFWKFAVDREWVLDALLYCPVNFIVIWRFLLGACKLIYSIVKVKVLPKSGHEGPEDE